MAATDLPLSTRDWLPSDSEQLLSATEAQLSANDSAGNEPHVAAQKPHMSGLTDTCGLQFSAVCLSSQSLTRVSSHLQ